MSVTLWSHAFRVMSGSSCPFFYLTVVWGNFNWDVQLAREIRERVIGSPASSSSSYLFFSFGLCLVVVEKCAHELLNDRYHG
jgi:hypothetical protein